MTYLEPNNYNRVQCFTTDIGDKRVAFTNESVFLVQVGRYAKGTYKTKHHIVGNIHLAYMYYNMINISLGYKKRLYCGSFNNPVIVKQSS